MSEVKEKVLVIRKPNKTIHVVPLINKTILEHADKKLPASQRSKFEVMDADKAEKLPFIDKDYVTPMEAQAKAQTLVKENQAQADRIAELEAMLEAAKGNTAGAAGTEPKDYSKLNVAALKAELTTRAIAFDDTIATKAPLIELLTKDDTDKAAATAQ